MHRLRIHQQEMQAPQRKPRRSLSPLLCNVYSQEVQRRRPSLLQQQPLHCRLQHWHQRQTLLPGPEAQQVSLQQVLKKAPALALP